MAEPNKRTSSALQGASAGAKIGSVVPGIGTAIGGIIGAIGGALFGGKGTYAQTDGHRVVGTIGPSGFSGTSYGLASNNGQQYVDVLDDRYGFNSTVQEISKRVFNETYGPNAAPVEIDYTGPADGATFWASFENVIRDAGNAYKKAVAEQEAAAKAQQNIVEKIFSPVLAPSPVAKKIGIDEGVAKQLATPQESSEIESIVQPQYAFLIIAVIAAAIFFFKRG